MNVSRHYLQRVGGLLLALLLMWIGVTGRLGSLLGAIITPDAMVDGQEVNGTPIVDGSTLPVIITGTQLSMPQISQLAWNAGIKTQSVLATAIAICMAESGGKSDIVNGIGATGLWQILISAHPSYTTKQMQDPVQNAAAMYKISSAGTNWCPWQSYDGANCGGGHNHSYAAFLGQANVAAAATIVGNTGASQK